MPIGAFGHALEMESANVGKRACEPCLFCAPGVHGTGRQGSPL